MTETLRYVMRGEFRPPAEPTRIAQVVLRPNGGASQDVSDISAEPLMHFVPAQPTW